MAKLEKTYKVSNNKYNIVLKILSGSPIDDYEIIKFQYQESQNYLTPQELRNLGEYLVQTANEIENNFTEKGRLKIK